jgi:signal transduction histidine kinase
MVSALEKSGNDHRKCLEESLLLQKRLRQLTHRVLAAQEDERRGISEELQNEIAQTLLAINVRLLSLKEEARGNARGLKKGIATAQRMVTKSVKSVQKVVRKAGSV